MIGRPPQVTESEIYYVYVLVRLDLPVSQILVQAIHASIEATRKLFPPYLPDHPHLVLCGVKSELDLKKASERLAHKEIPYSVWREPDLNDEITSLSSGPICGDTRKAFRSYDLITMEDLLCSKR